MSKRILKVEVESDFLSKVSNCAVFKAISELIWNAFDADAKKVVVKINEDSIFGGIKSIDIIDDGYGILPEIADAHFSKLGGSWKKNKNKTESGRYLHGQEGQGRFKAFSLGKNVDWCTAYFDEKEKCYKSYTISGSAEDIGNFSLTIPEDTKINKPGTTVNISELNNKGCSIGKKSIIDHMSCTFAIYLMKYPSVNLYIDDVKVNPEDKILHQATLNIPSVLFEHENFDYKLKVIEWKFNTKNELHYCNENGFPLHVYDKSIRGTSDFFYTAYLTSEHVSRLSHKGVLELGGLEPSLKEVTEKAIDKLKSHFLSRRLEKSLSMIEKWRDEGIYPYDVLGGDAINNAERQMFNVLAINISQELPEFNRSSTKVKKLQFRLLKQIVSSNPNDLQIIFEEVFNLSKKKQSELAELLHDISLTSIINASKVISDRLKFIAGLEHIIFEPEKKKVLKERSQLHKILAENTWVFGDAFSMSVNDQSLTDILNKHLNKKNIKLSPNETVTRIDGKRGIVDLMLTRAIPQNHSNQLEHLVIELKAPKVSIGPEEIRQIEDYAYSVARDERFNKLDTKWNFWIISNDLTEYTETRLKPDHTSQGILYNADNVTIYVKTWGQLIEECKHRLEFVRSHLNIDVSTTDGLQYLKENYSEYIESVIEVNDLEMGFQ